MDTPKFYSNFRLREIVEEYIHSERDRQVLIEKYCNKKTIGQLAGQFYLSETSIKTSYPKAPRSYSRSWRRMNRKVAERCLKDDRLLTRKRSFFYA